MTLPIFTAVPGEAWEGDLVAALEPAELGVTVVRRCVDVADLLAAAAAGRGRAVLVSPRLRRLDRDVLTRLAVAGVAVLGLVSPGDEDGRVRLHQLDIARVLDADVAAETLVAEVVAAVGMSRRASDRPPERARLDADVVASAAYGDPGTALPDVPSAGSEPAPAAPADLPPIAGQIVAVWGPTGAPGRTTVAVTLAAELARLGQEVLLVDADVYGGVVAQVLGLLDDAPGIAAAARLANTGTLDREALARVAPVVLPKMRVLTGISRADRWPELRPAALDVVLTVARSVADVVVVDCGFCLEQDEEISFDTAAPRRNGATVTVLQSADTILAVGSADPVGVQRLVRALGELRELVTEGTIRVVVNRVREGPVGPDPETSLTAALGRYAGIRAPALVPHDGRALDDAMLLGRTITEVAPHSPARVAVAALAQGLLADAAAPARAARSSRGPLRWLRALRGSAGKQAAADAPTDSRRSA